MQKSYAEQYALLEGEHWWFRARRLILQELLGRFTWPPRPNILEIGVGPGCNLREIYPSDACLVGVEPDPALAAFAALRAPGPVFQSTIDQLPAEIRDASYDGVALFDVLEHIEDDAHALQIVNRKLKPGGRVLLSAPAFNWLWGQQDVVNQHHRRYTLRQIRRKLQDAGFMVERVTYFNTFLFPAIAAVRLAARLYPRAPKPEGDFTYVRKTSSPVLLHLFAMERFFLRHINFPFGVSLFAAARKR